MACSSARASRAPIAGSGPRSSDCSDVIAVSRPKTVMNHGMPAAKRGRRNSPVRMRSAAKSAIERSKARRRLSQPPRTRGTRSVHAATTSPSVSRSSVRCSASSASVSGSSEGTTSTVRSQRSWGSRERSKTAPPSSIRPSWERTIRVLRSPAGSTIRICLRASSYVAGAAGGRSGAFKGSPSAKSWSLTEMMSAKSAASSSETSKSSRCMLSFRIAIRSCMPEPTNRSREMESASCGRLSKLAFRRKKAAAKCSTRPDDSRSRGDPCTESRRRERNRVSCAKKPLVSAAMSPRSSDMQNVDPSRIVNTRDDRHVLRTTLAPLDCASALTTISSTLTCNGRVRANMTQSATSSGVTGSTPSYTAFAASASPR